MAAPSPTSAGAAGLLLGISRDAGPGAPAPLPRDCRHLSMPLFAADASSVQQQQEPVKERKVPLAKLVPAGSVRVQQATAAAAAPAVAPAAVPQPPVPQDPVLLPPPQIQLHQGDQPRGQSSRLKRRLVSEAFEVVEAAPVAAPPPGPYQAAFQSRVWSGRSSTHSDHSSVGV